MTFRFRRVRGPATVERALRYIEWCLARRAHSTAEIRERLTKKEYPEKIIREAVAEAMERGYLNDAAFAQGWVQSRIRTRPRGRAILAAELRQKGVSKELVAEVVETISPDEEVEMIQALIHKRPPSENRLKTMSYLGRKGFTYPAIKKAFEIAKRED